MQNIFTFFFTRCLFPFNFIQISNIIFATVTTKFLLVCTFIEELMIWEFCHVQHFNTNILYSVIRVFFEGPRKTLIISNWFFHINNLLNHFLLNLLLSLFLFFDESSSLFRYHKILLFNICYDLFLSLSYEFISFSFFFIQH